MKMNCTNKQDFINAQCLSESALGMIRSCALPSFEHTLGNLLEDFTICDAGYTKTRCRKWGDWWNLLYFTWNRNQFKRSVLNEQMQLICVILSLYKAPLRLIGRCFYCMDCSCLLTFWCWSVLIYYIHISVKFLNGVFSQQQQKKNYSPMFLYLIY